MNILALLNILNSRINVDKNKHDSEIDRLSNERDTAKSDEKAIFDAANKYYKEHDVKNLQEQLENSKKK
jgi:hypothetical protein